MTLQTSWKDNLTDTLSMVFAENKDLTQNECIYVQALYDSYHDSELLVGRKNKYRYVRSLGDKNTLDCIAMADDRKAHHFVQLLKQADQPESYQRMFVTVCSDILHRGNEIDVKSKAYQAQFYPMLVSQDLFFGIVNPTGLLPHVIGSLADQLGQEKALIPQIC
jgi:hypothetical protein